MSKVKVGDLCFYRNIPVIIISVSKNQKSIRIKNIETNNFNTVKSKTCECLFPGGVDTVSEYFLQTNNFYNKTKSSQK